MIPTTQTTPPKTAEMPARILLRMQAMPAKTLPRILPRTRAIPPTARILTTSLTADNQSSPDGRELSLSAYINHVIAPERRRNEVFYDF